MARLRPYPLFRIRPLRDFLATESAGGVAIVAAAIAALLWANSPWHAAYEELWTTVFEFRVGSQALTLDLRHWVNEGLMTIFFLVVGLEIKRELVEGELKDARHRALPLFAAFGGMLAPALLFAVMNLGKPEIRGWGIPMATDIALAVGLMSLAGNRVRPSLKLFLLSLAIVDDVGAIVVIALFYGTSGNRAWLVLAATAVLLTLLVQRRRVHAMPVYLGLGACLWLALHWAGIHATLAGVILGLLAPPKPHLPPELIDQTRLTNLSSVEDALETSRLARGSVSVVAWLEHRLHPWSSFAVVPLFALANAGVTVSVESLRSAVTSSVTAGLVTGLVIGKPLGILGASALAVRLGVATLPKGVTWFGVTGAALLAGVGFTVSVFIAELTFDRPVIDNAKLGILAASAIAGSLGVIVLRVVRPRGTSTRLVARID